MGAELLCLLYTITLYSCIEVKVVLISEQYSQLKDLVDFV